MSDDKQTIRADVVIFGAGVTGLTAAHELAERNFRVAVIDPDYTGESPQFPDTYEENPGVGGVARSQWGFIDNAAERLDPFQRPFAVSDEMNSVLPTAGNETVLVSYQFADEVRLSHVVDFCSRQGHGDITDALKPIIDNLGGAELLAYIVPRPVTPKEFETIAGWYKKAVADTRLDDKQKRVLLDLLPTDVEVYNLEKGDITSRLKDTLGTMIDPKQDRFKETFAALDRSLDDSRAALHAINVVVEKLAGSPMLKQSGAPIPRQPTGTVAVYANRAALPGEHGFRFFPSFYRHVFDTMKRIPLTNPFVPSENATYERQGRSTVFDNLLPVQTVGYVGDGSKPSLQLPRRAPSSMEEMNELFRGFISRVGFSSSDVSRLTRGFLKYATSCRRRREEEYEKISWYRFLDGDRLSPRGRFLMETTPGTLLALSGSDGDARTQGTIGLQCMSDQFTGGAQSDMLLNGPTDTAWFGPWYRYLSLQDVTFIRGRLDGFKSNGSDGVDPVVTILPSPSDPNQGERSAIFRPLEENRPVYFIIALPLIPAYRQAKSFLDELRSSPNSARDFEQLCRFPGTESPDDLERAVELPYPPGPLRHMTGIQYFFNQDVRLWKAHTQYLDAPAGLTAISQPQFWLESRDIISGYRSVLSVDIGTWQRPTRGGRPLPGTSPCPGDYGWGKTKDDLAQLVWRQIAAGHATDFTPDEGDWISPPHPFRYHVDDNLVFFDDGTGRAVLSGNRTPFLVNEVGRYRSRPGADGQPAAPDYKARIKYDVALGQYILAGIHMQTYTRINSMEAACESGRHAVNALLREIGYRGEGCAIWDPEDCEPSDLAPLKRIDEEMCARGLPHMLDILGDGGSEDWSLMMPLAIRR